ncbi:MAG: hypothetical protein A2138_23310 [Deltaproteobacteria bacterium RBG_16_71_12]|nr:MAG: hypothetical protein A2138_23310 [Deltaproteobacteria bacterium RBG_16_71_12]
MRTLSVFALLLAGSACHPLACWHPADLPKDPPLVLQSQDDWPREKVEVRLDQLGIPHVFGQSEPDLAYGLGVMHARDRMFQMMLLIHAGEGRLTEMLGADFLPVDRDNRTILMHGIDEELAAASPRDREIVEAYCAGVNQGASMVGGSAEMAILGLEWEPITPREVLAVTRFQQWDQSVGFWEEMARWRLVKAKGATAPVVAELMRDTPSGGVPIVAADEHDGAAFTPPAPDTSLHVPLHEQTPAPLVAVTRATGLRAQLAQELKAWFPRRAQGASNSWSVSGEHTAAGAPVLANDPHLRHGAPGIFYMVHLEGPDFSVVGGSFPGIPGVLIGHGRHIAWGITNAFADTVDVVALRTPEGTDGVYTVDDTSHAFGERIEQFKLGKGEDAEVVTRTIQTSIFGPVLPPDWGSDDETPPPLTGEKLAVQWTAAQMPGELANLVSAFWDLAESENVEDAFQAVQEFAAPAMSVNMAFTDGTIAYRLSGVIPVRDGQRVDFPKDGGRRSSLWAGRMDDAQKPQETNPAKGFINATNQRIVENDVASQRFVGFEGGMPWRAMQVDARLRAMLEAGKPSTDEILSIQQDATFLEASTLAPILAAHCGTRPVPGHDEARVKDFCDAVGEFDGVYAIDAIAAPYARLRHELFLAVLGAHVDPFLAGDLSGESFVQMALFDLIQAEHDSGATAVFDDPATEPREGLDGFVTRALKPALDAVVADFGGGKADWRWGKGHTMSLRGALSSAPAIGFLFETAAREEAGQSNTPRAERGDPTNHFRVTNGAGLRLIAEMSDPPTVRMINDSGQSGHFGHRHLEDQYPLWSKGEPRVLMLSKDQVAAELDGAMDILPK